MLPSTHGQQLEEPTMQRNAFHRAFALCLSAVLTVALLGGIDQLAQHQGSDTQLAQAAASRA
jgi:hypothetical protein